MKLFGAKKKPCTAIIVAAGCSSRMGDIDKITADLDGIPLIVRTMLAFQSELCIDQMILVTAEDKIGQMEEWKSEYGITKLEKIIPGGDTRTQSVYFGLTAMKNGEALVAVHDGARPLVTHEIIADTVARARSAHAAVPAVPVKDTVKRAENGLVCETIDRGTLRAVQTPQVFDRDLLMAAMQKAAENGIECTDEAMALESLGVTVHLTNGSEENLKITTPLDLRVAECIIKERTCESAMDMTFTP